MAPCFALFVYSGTAYAAGDQARVASRGEPGAQDRTSRISSRRYRTDQGQDGQRGHVQDLLGGVQGDENDVLRKVRLGQLHAVVHGALPWHDRTRGEGDRPALRFRNYDEVNNVRARLQPDMDDHRGQGFKVLGWLNLGFLYTFSKEPLLPWTPPGSRSVGPGRRSHGQGHVQGTGHNAGLPVHLGRGNIAVHQQIDCALSTPFVR